MSFTDPDRPDESVVVVVGVTNELLPRFPTWAVWKEFPWRDRIFETTVDVEVKFRLRRHGLQVGPPLTQE